MAAEQVCQFHDSPVFATGLHISQTRKQDITVVNAIYDKSMHQDVQVDPREKRAGSGYILKMVETCFNHMLHMWIKAKLRVQNDTQVL